MATVITLTTYGTSGSKQRAFVMAEPFAMDLVKRVMGFLVLRECGDQFKAFKEEDPQEFAYLMNFATSGNWPKFVEYVNDVFNLTISHEQVDLTDVPSAQKAVEFAREFTQ